MIAMADWLPEYQELAGIKARALTLDSRTLTAGAIFVALKGQQVDGHDFIDTAIRRGAVAVLAERHTDRTAASVPVCVVADLRRRLGDLAHRFYGSVSAKLRVIGITGTNGKTSTSQYIAQAFASLGQSCGVVGTNGQGLWGQLRPMVNTTPDVISLHAELAAQYQQGAEVCAVEASSHGLHQHRLDGVRFGTAVFTNLSRDHLDYHATMAAYGRAKWQLMSWPGLQHAVVNLDDTWVQTHLASIKAETITTYSIEREADVFARAVHCHSGGINAQLITRHGDADLHLSLIGRFNLSNILAALAVLLAEGITLATAVQVLAAAHPVVGRMEILQQPGSPTVVVDYAHTPDALAQALQAAREHVPARLGVVFGCGGDRDRGKRPQMAAVAERHADFIIVTDDNPRTEDAAAIRAQISAGFSATAPYEVIADRQAAIVSALDRCTPEDVVLVAGKGHESYQDIAGVKHPFSDQATVRRWQEARDVG